MASTPADPLCEICREIEFFRLACQGWSSEESTQLEMMQDNMDFRRFEEDMRYGVKLGLVCEVIARKDRCALCRAISDVLRNGTYDENHLCGVGPMNFCGQNMQTRPRRFTNRMGVIVVSPKFDGRPGPHEPTAILQFQACDSHIPTVKDTHTPPAALKGERRFPKFSGRLIDPEKLDLGLVQHWLRLCQAIHREGCAQLPERLFHLESLLLIDVTRWCVVDAPHDCQYAALSYCWGAANTVKHTIANSSTLRKEGSLNREDLPRTIADAILLTRGLGQRYLWVDAICIIQNDKASKQVQILQMGSIYSRATLTIVAAAGDNANAGLPGVRPKSRNAQQVVLRTPDHNLITVIDGPAYGGVGTSAWATRAWTMQERLLSRRRLIFTESQVYWQCREAVWLEETVLEGTQRQEFRRGHPPGSTDKEEVELIGSGYGSYRVYEHLVHEYCQRCWTFKSDILNAFTGITQSLSILYSHGDYIWGLPKTRFNWALSWVLEYGARNEASCNVVSKDGSSQSVQFPSWSWTAWAATGDSVSVKYAEPGDWNSFVDPEIVFYLEDTSGQLLEIAERFQSLAADNKKIGFWGQVYDGRLHKTREQWKGYPRRISGTSVIHNPNYALTTGLLHFWSSVARLQILRWSEGPEDEVSYDALPLGDDGAEFQDIVDIHLGFADCLSWQKKPHDRKPAEGRKRMDEVQELQPWQTNRWGGHNIWEELGKMGDFSMDANYGVEVDHRRYGRRAAPRIQDTSIHLGVPVGYKEPGDKSWVCEQFAADFVIIGRSLYGPKWSLRALIVEWREEEAYRIGHAIIGEEDWVGLQNREWKLVKLG